jgi:hypothetical protein
MMWGPQMSDRTLAEKCEYCGRQSADCPAQYAHLNVLRREDMEAAARGVTNCRNACAARIRELEAEVAENFALHAAALTRIAELEPIKSAARRMRVAEGKQTMAWHCGDRTTVPFLVEEARKARVDLDAALAALSGEPK